VAGYGTGAALIYRKRTIWSLLAIMAFSLCLGWWRGAIYMHKLAEYQPLYLHNVTLTAAAVDDAVYGKTLSCLSMLTASNLPMGRIWQANWNSVVSARVPSTREIRY
jgi:hypothetical protein